MQSNHTHRTVRYLKLSTVPGVAKLNLQQYTNTNTQRVYWQQVQHKMPTNTELNNILKRIRAVQKEFGDGSKSSKKSDNSFAGRVERSKVNIS